MNQTSVAYVFSKTGDDYYVYCNIINKDIVISSRYVPNGVDVVGKWIRVVLSGENVCEQVVLLDGVFKTRIVDGILEVKANIICHRIMYGLKLFKSKPFGKIIDAHVATRYACVGQRYDIWLTRCNEWGPNFQWAISTDQDEPFPAPIKKEHSHEDEVAVVCARNDQGCSIAWSKDLGSRIEVHFSDWKSSLLGKWIKVEVDYHKKQTYEPELIEEKYHTRVNGGVVEIKVVLECSPNSPNTLHHSYFGNISDPEAIICNTLPVGLYNAWISYDEADNLWRISNTKDTRLRLIKT